MLTLVLADSAVEARELSIDERVAAQKAIEQVYWNHRLWPKDNPGPKPPLLSVMPDQTIRAKVDDYLRKSNALERFWQRPVTAEQLQAELDRMAKNTRDGAMLQELFGALGNDPFVIAETLGRQTLVDRLIRNWYADDTRFHGDVRTKAEAALAACTNVDCMRKMGGKYRETTWKLRAEGAGVSEDKERDQVVHLDVDEWAVHRSSLAKKLGATAESLPTGRPSVLEEVPEAFIVTALLSQREGVNTAASVAWPKRTFDDWWAAESSGTGRTGIEPVSGSFTLPNAPVGVCTNDSWTPTSTASGVPAGRYRTAAVWTGAEMIVWGGYNGISDLNTGGSYRPSTDSWFATSTTSAPSARSAPTVVWTGAEVIVWGGFAGTTYLNSGGGYNPATQSWSATSTTNAPSARSGHVAVWTGTNMIVWGGTGGPSFFDTGGRYDPSTGTWTATVLGLDVPSPRARATAVWAGTVMIVWGGANFGGVLNTGGRYDPAADTWSPTSTTNAPTGRVYHGFVWTGTEMIVWGGSSLPGLLATGGRYSPATDSWTATSTGPSVPEGREAATAEWTGAEMIVWGGSRGVALDTGGRYNVATDSWTPVSTGANVPSARSFLVSAWTNTEMIVWGGTPTSTSGGRYCACPDGRIYYRDADGDGYGSPVASISACDGLLPAGYVADDTDCNDSNVAIHPGAVDAACDGLDSDCIGIEELTSETAGLGWSPGDKTNLEWIATPGAAAYAVYVGGSATMMQLLTIGGDSCTATTTTSNSSGNTLTATPAVGELWWYLVRPGNALCVGSIGNATAGPRIQNDYCDDFNACTTDSCDAVLGCVHVDTTAACNDGNVCTTGDVCSGGTCNGTLAPAANHLVISQIQLDGTPGGSDEFIEIYNPTLAPISLSGMSLQYKPASGTSFAVHAFGMSGPTQVPARGWILVAPTGYDGTPARDEQLNAFNLQTGGGHVFLVSNTTPLTGSCPSAGVIIDKVGWGTANCPEGSAPTSPTVNNSILRKPGGVCGNGTDTNFNHMDFLSQTPSTPRNSTSPPQP